MKRDELGLQLWEDLCTCANRVENMNKHIYFFWHRTMPQIVLCAQPILCVVRNFFLHVGVYGFVESVCVTTELVPVTKTKVKHRRIDKKRIVMYLLYLHSNRLIQGTVK